MSNSRYMFSLSPVNALKLQQIYFVYVSTGLAWRPSSLPLSLSFWFNLKITHSRSVLADPKFTYSYGYSFGVLILSFLLSEFTGGDLHSFEIKNISKLEWNIQRQRSLRWCRMNSFILFLILFLIIFRNLCNISVHLPPSTQMGPNWEK